MKITGNVYALDSTKGGGAYAYVILGPEIILIDTGFPGKWRAMRKELLSIGIQLDQIKHILLTHYDIDHVGNAAVLQRLSGAKLWASGEDLPVIMGKAERQGFKKYFKYLFRITPPKDVCPFVTGREIAGIDVISTPGHTPGHLCFLYRDVLFAGDLLLSKKGSLKPYPKAWNWDQNKMMESVGLLSQIPFMWVCPGHGIPVERGNFSAFRASV